MKISILAYGSRGDVQPFLALATGLRKVGHSVLLAAPYRFSDLAAALHVPFFPLAGDPQEISVAINAAGTNLYGMVKSIRDYAVGIAPQVVSQMMEASAGADLLVHSFLFTSGAHGLARSMGIPDISIQTFPMFAPTRAYPNVGFPPLGGTGNYLSHWLATQVFRLGSESGFRQIQSLLPATFPRDLSWPFEGQHPSPLLIACSPHVIPPDRHWRENVHVSGYLFLDEEGYQPPADLDQFINAGPAPVCVTFGSMVNKATERMRAQVLGALDRQGERVILLSGWGIPASSSAKSVFCLDSVPHSWLFPRCKVVIHHGGAGTTAAALRAGVPAIIIPHTADQPFWARRVRELGAGALPMPIQGLSTPRMLAALDEVSRPEIIAGARRLANELASEDGVGMAVRLIERQMEINK